MKALGLVLARGGSQGLPGKHLLPLAGKAVVRHTIELADRTEALERVVLSTDDERIGSSARGTRVEFLPRPAELATPSAPVQWAMRHAVRATVGRDGLRPDRVVLLYGNVPVRPRRVIERGLALAESSGADTILSLSEVGKMHPLWMHTLDGDRILPYKEHKTFRRQDLPPVYYHDGALVLVRTDLLMDESLDRLGPHAWFGEDRRGLLSPGEPAVEIDTRLDYYLAQAILSHGDGA